MTYSRAVRGTLTGVAAVLLAAGPIAVTPAFAAPALPGIAHQAPANGVLALQAAPNARDIGGVSATAGKIKSGLVYRTDALNRLTDADQQALVSAGITNIIDFRSPTERAANPDKIPGSIPVQTLPIYDPANDFYTFFAKAVQGGPEYQKQVLGDGKAAQYMVDYYKWMITDGTARAQLSQALKTIADANGPVLYHCTQGKDRTGVMTAILMSILGTSNSDIYANYLLSNEKLAASNKATLDALVAQGLVQDRTLFEPVLGVQKEFLDAALNQINASYGSMTTFVAQGLGLNGDVTGKLTNRLVEKSGPSTGSFG
ncbi:tyrosine-protein phosphatase [Nocardia inohanensis]|uniref:tyrosine-protein phosphatase n=1 Tax=Nocardia inohanensis TaxID=209246 RepID=UPI000A4B6AD5|nr:tyrosine-protein phosphatase [Nocardia inohanensis]